MAITLAAASTAVLSWLIERIRFGRMVKAAEKIAAGQLTSARAVKDYVRGYEEAGCDELVLFPCVPGIDELERLQEALA